MWAAACAPPGAAFEPRSRAAAVVRGGLLALTMASAGCSAPAVEGYQLQAPPEGFLYVVSQPAGQGPLGGLPRAGQGAWLGDFHSDEPRSWFEVTRYRGAAAREDADAARAARGGRLGASGLTTLGPLREVPLTAGGAAWAWTEERRDGEGRLRSMRVTAVVSFDTVSFALELDTEVQERMTEAHLDAVLASFALGRTRVHGPAVTGAGALVAALAFLLLRRARRTGHTAFRLATLPRGPLPSGSAPPPPSGPPTLPTRDAP